MKFGLKKEIKGEAKGAGVFNLLNLETFIAS